MGNSAGTAPGTYSYYTCTGTTLSGTFTKRTFLDSGTWTFAAASDKNKKTEIKYDVYNPDLIKECARLKYNRYFYTDDARKKIHDGFYYQDIKDN